MRSVALRIVNDVSRVTDINHENHFAWQAQYLVRLEGDACAGDVFAQLLDIYGVDCDFDLDCDFMHQPITLGP